MNNILSSTTARRLMAVIALLLVASPCHAAERPNVVLVMTDDQGYGDLSCHGNPVLTTPHLDRLHAQSVRFTDFHVAPMCTPTRGQLLTGRDAIDNGATFVCLGRSMMRGSLPTMADVFAASGYRTGLFGKWHLGDSYPHRPLDRGFHEVVRHGAWGITSIPDYFGNDYFDDTYRHQGRLEKYSGYCTDVWFDAAMKWMKAQQAAGRPFFAYLPTNVPHTPHWVADRYAEPYKGRGPAKFFGMIANFDENMGRLLAFLDSTGLRDNTLLIFMTDNGTAAGEKVYNAGMRGKKRSLYDGGHRVPLFVRWPNGGIGKPRDIEALTHCQDLLPTLIDLCGLRAADTLDHDGVSLAPLLRGKTGALPDPDRMLVVQYQAVPKKSDAAVLWRKWRLVKESELYRIDADPGQTDNLAAKHPKIARAMRDHYERWWADAAAPLSETRYIHIGSSRADPMMLYSSDWQGSYADNFGNLRAGDRIGWWDVIVER
ncbi:MAG: arylsulfatase, partial [Gemmatimonadales bacterium]